MLLDEPTRGIDAGRKAQIYQLIDELAAQKGDTNGKRYPPELLGTCDRIAVMCKGYLHPARNVGDIDEHMIMIEAPTSRRPHEHRTTDTASTTKNDTAAILSLDRSSACFVRPSQS